MKFISPILTFSSLLDMIHAVIGQLCATFPLPWVFLALYIFAMGILFDKYLINLSHFLSLFPERNLLI